MQGMFVLTQPAGDEVGEKKATDGEQESEDQTPKERVGIDIRSPLMILLAEGHTHQHTGTCRDEHTDGEHELYDRLRQVDGTDAIAANQIAHDDTVDHISQTPWQASHT